MRGFIHYAQSRRRRPTALQLHRALMVRHANDLVFCRIAFASCHCMGTGGEHPNIAHPRKHRALPAWKTQRHSRISSAAAWLSAPIPGDHPAICGASDDLAILARPCVPLHIAGRCRKVTAFLLVSKSGSSEPGSALLLLLTPLALRLLRLIFLAPLLVTASSRPFFLCSGVSLHFSLQLQGLGMERALKLPQLITCARLDSDPDYRRGNERSHRDGCNYAPKRPRRSVLIGTRITLPRRFIHCPVPMIPSRMIPKGTSIFTMTRVWHAYRTPGPRASQPQASLGPTSDAAG